jgi:hypothetical protein
VSEKSITRWQAGLVRQEKTSRRNVAGLAGTCSGGKFVVSRGGEAFGGQARGPNRKFRLGLSFQSPKTFVPKVSGLPSHMPRSPAAVT